MSKNNIVFLIGLLLFLMPVLFGFPPRWKDFIDIVFGLILIILSFSVAIKRRSSIRKSRRNRKSLNTTPAFVDGMGDQIKQEMEGATTPKIPQEENSSSNEGNVTPSI